MTRGPDSGPMKRRCSGTANSTGEQCRLPPIRGGTVCHKHGGSAPQVRAAAGRRLAEAQALTTYERYSVNGNSPGPVDVLAELSRLVAEVVRFRDFTAGRIEALTAEEWAAHDAAAAAEVGLFERATERASRLLIDIARLGLDARAVEAERERAVRDFWVRERIGEKTAAIVTFILIRLGHPDPRQDPAVRAICTEAFRTIGPGGG
jgi:hypothetical protein